MIIILLTSFFSYYLNSNKNIVQLNNMTNTYVL